MKKTLNTIGLLSIMVFAFPSVASAHSIHGNGLMGSLMNGLAHPFLGIDHILAMIAVGMIATQIMPQKLLWNLPLTFITAMIIGGILAMTGFEAPFIEIGITLSLIVFGGMILTSERQRFKQLNWAIPGIALFGLFHGHAHGTELPFTTNPMIYAIGFTLTTATLHMLGITLAKCIKTTKRGNAILKLTAGTMTMIGILILAIP